MTRREKCNAVIDTLLEMERREVEHPNYLLMSTDGHFPKIPQKEVLAIMKCLSRLPRCIDLKYQYRYPNIDAIYADADLMSEIQLDAVELRDIAPNLEKDSIRFCLDIVDFTIRIGNDFHNQLEYARKIDLLKKQQQTKDNVALELIVKDEKIYINIVQNHQKYLLRDLSRSAYFIEFFSYAEKHQNTPFKLSDVGKTTYDIYNLLQRTMKDPCIYKAFFKIKGKNGTVIANFRPTYTDLIATKTSVEKIEQLIRPDK